MIKTDIIIIGAGPVGLFTVFEAGLLKLKCHLIDALPIPGGQCAEIYPKKPIYDIPGYPEILAGDLVDNLMNQIKPFNPGFTLGETALNVEKSANNQFIVTTKEGTQHQAPVVAIAGGLGVFIPRKPPIQNISSFENKGINYIVKDPDLFKDKRIVISGGGDSALDWALYFANGFCSDVTLIHRSQQFRAHPDSVQRAMDMANNGTLKIILDSEVLELQTTPLICIFALFSSSIKKLVVDPVPIPITVSFCRSGSINLKACLAEFSFFKSWFMLL